MKIKRCLLNKLEEYKLLKKIIQLNDFSYVSVAFYVTVNE